MLTWLTRCLSRDKRRRIFAYFDGSSWQRADPILVMSVLEAECSELNDLLRLLSAREDLVPAGAVRDAMTSGKKAASDALIAATRKAFNVEPLGQKRGLTQAETLALFTKFFLFLEDCAAEARPFVNSPGADSHSPATSLIESSSASGEVASPSSVPAAMS